MKRFLFCLVLLTACKTTPAPEPQKLQVLTSFYPIEFFTEAVAGDRVEITNLTPAGMEPHDYEPSAAQFAKMEEADLILAQGSGLEPWLKDASETLSQAGVPLVELNGHEEKDPHTWLDPVLAMGMVETIHDALVELDPDGEAVYTANANELLASLQTLDADFKAGLSTCTLNTFISAHDAFNYLAKRYNLTADGVSGLSPEDEPSAQALSALLEKIQGTGIEYIYFEERTNPRTAQVLVDEAGLTPLVLHTLEFLTQEEANQGEDYFSLMRDNITQLKTGLQCQ